MSKMEKEEASSSSSSAAASTSTNIRRGQPILPGEIQQHFSLPESIIYYIAMHPSNAKVYKKLIRTCKYFYNQNPFLVVNELHYGIHLNGIHDENIEAKWKFYFEATPTVIDMDPYMDIVQGKLWIVKCCSVWPLNEMQNNIAASIVSKVYRCDAYSIALEFQTITFDEFLLLASNVEDLTIQWCTINENDGETEVMVEKIIEKVPKLRELRWWFGHASECFSPNTVAELLKIEHFGNITSLKMNDVLEVFDGKPLFEAIKMKHKNMRVDLYYFEHRHEFSIQFKRKIDEIIDEILSTQVFTYKPPLIFYNNADDLNKYRKMGEIYYRYVNTQF